MTGMTICILNGVLAFCKKYGIGHNQHSALAAADRFVYERIRAAIAVAEGGAG